MIHFLPLDVQKDIGSADKMESDDTDISLLEKVPSTRM